MNTNFGLLGKQFTIPIIWALNIGSILTFLFSGIIMLIYSVIPTKSYSKDLLSFAYKKPLYSVVFCVIFLFAATFFVQTILGVGIPLTGNTTAILSSNSLPFGLTKDLPNINLSFPVSAAFQWPFWLAITAAALCICARIYHRKLSATHKIAPVTTEAPATPTVTSAST